jgi:hypothetical protein
MTVRSKPKRSTVWGRRPGRAGEHAPAVRQPTGDQAVATPLRNRRQGGESEDRALYTCSCGFVFDALVSTSVGCPQCGKTQAW